MGTFAASNVVLLPFPFSALSRTKLRPALILAMLDREDYLLCQITSNPYADPLAVEIQSRDFLSGSLARTSYARPGKLFAANQSLITHAVGTLNPECLARVVQQIIGLLQRGKAQ